MNEVNEETLKQGNYEKQEESIDLVLNEDKPKKKTILLVEDDESLIKLATCFLERYGNYNVISANNGLEGVKTYFQRKDEIDAVILDFQMPIMDGKGAFDELKKINPDVKVIVATGSYLSNRLQDLINNGVSAYIPKPYTKTEFLEIVNNVLNS